MQIKEKMNGHLQYDLIFSEEEEEVCDTLKLTKIRSIYSCRQVFAILFSI